ncbi:MAG: methyltransferase domain-containing protein [Actinomycetota bacterium]
MSAPDRQRALGLYRRKASTYDRLALPTRRIRRHAVARMQLRPGQTVIDVACGTGLTFSLLEEGIGTEGRLIGIDLSAEMLEVAKQRIAGEGWKNVTLIESPVEEAEIPVPADAALFFLSHDVMRSPAAIANVTGHLRPGGRVVSMGPKCAPRWAVPVNMVMHRIARRYVTTSEGFERPWEYLAEVVPDLEVKGLLAGGAYLAWGRVAEPR